jgi:catechol 2,3-dioxygenase-like lactoylglutathione lyase family enzyme
MKDSRPPPVGLASIRQLDYAILLCRDIGQMTAFYGNVLGFPVLEASPNWVVFKTGSTVLTLRQRGRSYDGEGPPAGSAAVQLAFRVAPAQVDICHHELLGEGVTILEPPKDQSFGHRTLFFADPEHNVLEIYADI